MISDLDALIDKRLYFRLLGKVHELKPVKTREFFKLTNALSKFESLQKNPNDVSEKILVDYFTDLFSSFCDTVGKKEIKEMTTAQIVGLVYLIIETVTGKTHVEAQKKKMIPPLEKLELPESRPFP